MTFSSPIAISNRPKPPSSAVESASSEDNSSEAASDLGGPRINGLTPGVGKEKGSRTSVASKPSEHRTSLSPSVSDSEFSNGDAQKPSPTTAGRPRVGSTSGLQSSKAKTTLQKFKGSEIQLKAGSDLAEDKTSSSDSDEDTQSSSEDGHQSKSQSQSGSVVESSIAGSKAAQYGLIPTTELQDLTKSSQYPVKAKTFTTIATICTTYWLQICNHLISSFICAG